MEHNALLYGGELGKALAIFTGLDDESGITRTGETLTPILDQWALPEIAVLRGEHLYGRVVPIALVAGEFSAVAVVNPAARNVLAVVTLASALNTAAGLSLYSMQLATEAAITATLAAAGFGNRRDPRSPASSQCPIFSGTDPAAVIGPELEQKQHAAADSVVFDNVPVVLSPGFGLVVVNQVVAAGDTVSFGWRERIARPRELRGR